MLSFAIQSEEESDAVVEFVHFMLFMIGILCILLHSSPLHLSSLIFIFIFFFVCLFVCLKYLFDKVDISC